MFCFDNTFSTLSEKVIFFELILDNMGDDEQQEDWKKYITGTDLLDMKLEDILVCIPPSFKIFVEFVDVYTYHSLALPSAPAIWPGLPCK